MGVSTIAVSNAAAQDTYRHEPPGYLVLHGTHSGAAKVRLPSPLAQPMPLQLQVETAGSYAGYVLLDRKWHPVRGAIVLLGHRAPNVAIPLFDSQRAVSRGTYELLLLADGPTTVSIPLAGKQDMDVHPNKDLTSLGRYFRPGLAAPKQSVFASAPINLKRGRHLLGVLVSYSEQREEQAGLVDACFTTAPRCLPTDPGMTGTTLSLGNGAWSASIQAYAASPVQFKTRTRAVLDSAHAAWTAHQEGFVLVLA